MILKRGALATDARGCSLLGRAPASRVRDPLGVMVRTRGGGLHWCRDPDGSEVYGGECQ